MRDPGSLLYNTMKRIDYRTWFVIRGSNTTVQP